MSKKAKRIMIGSLILNVLLLFTTVFLVEKYQEKPSNLLGTYQSEETNPKGLVMLSFYNDGTFEEYYRSKLIDSGSFTKEKNEAYILHSRLKDEMIVLIRKKVDSFYFYSDDQQVYLLQKVSDTPTAMK